MTQPEASRRDVVYATAKAELSDAKWPLQEQATKETKARGKTSPVIIGD